MSDDMLGRNIEHFRFDELLGEGGMGSVYLATDTVLNRQVAIKMMLPHYATNQSFQQRFIQEAQSAARLKHPNIISIFHVSPQQGRLYLVMEYVEQGDLRQYLKQLAEQRQPSDFSTVIHWGRQLADALYYAHQQGMFHRDVKPENILLRPISNPGDSTPILQPVLTDFGLVKLAEGIFLTTAEGPPIGSWPYMSPEQCRGENVDARSDVYALGITLFELVVGQRPYLPKNWPETFRMHTQDAIPSLKSFRFDVALDLENIVTKCLAKDARDRYQTCHELSVALQALQESMTKGSTSTPEAPPYIATVPDYPTQFQPIVPDKRFDQLIILVDSEAPRIITLDQSAFQIGRTLENDIVLPTRKIAISRQHARLERGPSGHYTITDLNSTNGTRVDRRPLPPNDPQPWPPGAFVTIGDYRLYIEPARDQADTDPFQNQGLSEATQIAQPVVDTSFASLMLEPETLVADPGGMATIQIRISNNASQVDHFSLVVDNLPEEWLTIQDAHGIQLMPGQMKNSEVTIRPPRNPSSIAGQHPFRIQAHSHVHDQSVSVVGYLQIRSFHDFRLDLQPRNLINRSAATLTIRNDGNSEGEYVVEASDPQAALDFRFDKRVRVPAGESRSIEVNIARRSRAGDEDNQAIPFEIKVINERGDWQAVPSDIVAGPPGGLAAPANIEADPVSASHESATSHFAFVTDLSPRQIKKTWTYYMETFHLKVTNTGSHVSHYTISMKQDSGLEHQLSKNSLALEPGESKTVNVRVRPRSKTPRQYAIEVIVQPDQGEPKRETAEYIVQADALTSARLASYQPERERGGLFILWFVVHAAWYGYWLVALLGGDLSGGYAAAFILYLVPAIVSIVGLWRWQKWSVGVHALSLLILLLSGAEIGITLAIAAISLIWLYVAIGDNWESFD
jgi:serine/threonine protein kinase